MIRQCLASFTLFADAIVAEFYGQTWRLCILDGKNYFQKKKFIFPIPSDGFYVATFNVQLC